MHEDLFYHMIYFEYYRNLCTNMKVMPKCQQRL